VRTNFDAAGKVSDHLELQAGWSLVLKVSSAEDDLSLAARLVREAGVIVHPGSFYGMASAGRLVISLLPEIEIFAEGIRRLAEESR
jgi:alanine-synthesizing transaminase